VVDRDLWSELARRAAEADGLITRADCLEVGVRGGTLSRVVERGLAQPVARGVLRLSGAPATRRQVLRAVVLAAGEPVAVCRRWALWLHGIGRGGAPASAPCVCLPYGRSVRLGAEHCAHRSRSLLDDVPVRVDGLPVTSVERSLLEVFGEVGVDRWRDLVASAVGDRLTDRNRLVTCLSDLGNVPGAGRMRVELADLPAGVGESRSGGEVLLLEACRRAGLPVPVVNHAVTVAVGRTRELDLAYPRWQLGYELDSRVWHSLPSQVQGDELKDLELAAIGWLVHRIPTRLLRTPRQLDRLLASTFAAAVARSAG
jgi:hypothetical protein